MQVPRIQHRKRRFFWAEVRIVAAWPDHVRPTARDEFFCPIDILPTIHAIAGTKLDRKIDGMDLSHLLVNGKAPKRKHILINFGSGVFVREKRFRLNQNGQICDIPIDSNSSRYSEAVTTDTVHDE